VFVFVFGGFFGDFGVFFYLFLVQSCMRGFLGRDCLWYIADGGSGIRRLSAPMLTGFFLPCFAW
jgi:hypothetical protein